MIFEKTRRTRCIACRCVRHRPGRAGRSARIRAAASVLTTLAAAACVATAQAQQSAPGLFLGPEIRVHENASGDQSFPTVTKSGPGDYLTVWQSESAPTNVTVTIGPPATSSTSTLHDPGDRPPRWPAA